MAAAPDGDTDGDTGEGFCQDMSGEELELELAQWDEPLVVDAYAAWCGPCQQMAPVMEQIARTYSATARPNPIRVVKFNTEEYGGLGFRHHHHHHHHRHHHHHHHHHHQPTTTNPPPQPPPPFRGHGGSAGRHEPAHCVVHGRGPGRASV